MIVSCTKGVEKRLHSLSWNLCLRLRDNIQVQRTVCLPIKMLPLTSKSKSGGHPVESIPVPYFFTVGEKRFRGKQSTPENNSNFFRSRKNQLEEYCFPHHAEEREKTWYLFLRSLGDIKLRCDAHSSCLGAWCPDRKTHAGSLGLWKHLISLCVRGQRLNYFLSTLDLECHLFLHSWFVFYFVINVELFRWISMPDTHAVTSCLIDSTYWASLGISFGLWSCLGPARMPQ